MSDLIRRPVRFDIDDAQDAATEWGFNCGPAALCAVLQMTPVEIRSHLLEFEKKGYTNPTLMFSILDGLGVKYHRLKTEMFPMYGLARIQWEGPWTAPGVPMRVRYRKTHWVASRFWDIDGWPQYEIFDVNAMCVGGWLRDCEWRQELVPWLLRQCVPGADGNWHITHSIEIQPPTPIFQLPTPSFQLPERSESVVAAARRATHVSSRLVASPARPAARRVLQKGPGHET